jgi:predicted MFS family arabinose efflux permease
MTSATAPAPPVVLHRWPSALVLAGAMFLVLFDSLAVATALPQIGDEFEIHPAQLQWVVTLYSLSIGGFLVLGGRICDLIGRRRVIVTSLAVSTLGLLVAAVAPALWVLLIGRVLQGLGAAFAIPAALASAATLFPDEPWRSRVFGVLAAAGNTAGLAGAVCGGLITSHYGWRWIFFAVVPVGAVAVLAARLLLPLDDPDRRPGDRLDLTGAVLATGGLLMLIYGASRIGEQHLDLLAVAAVGAGLLMLTALIVTERRSASPLVRPSVLRSSRLVASSLAFGAHSAAYAAVVVVGSLYLQDIHELSAAEVGFVLAPILLASLLSSLPSGMLIRRYGTRVVVAVALALNAATLAAVAVNARSGSLTVIVFWLVAWGFSIGPIYVGLTRECIGDARPADRGVASALFESTNHVGGAIAVALYLSLLGAGSGYGALQFIGAVIAASSVVSTLLIMPGRERSPQIVPD